MIKFISILSILSIFFSQQQTAIKESSDGFTKTIQYTLKENNIKSLIYNSVIGSVFIKKSQNKKNSILIEISSKNKEELDNFVLESDENLASKVICDFRNKESFNNHGYWNFGKSLKVYHTIYIHEAAIIQVETSAGSVNAYDINSELRLESSGGNISLSKISGKARVTTSGGSIYLEAVKGDVEGETSGGNISVMDLVGDIRLETSGGSIDIDAVDGNVDVETSGGNIEIRNVSQKVKCSTSGGSIELEKIKGSCDAETSGGNINFRDLENGLNGETSGGSIKGKNSSGNFELETNAGSIDLSRINGPVMAITNVGGIDIQFTLEDLKNRSKSYFETNMGNIDIEISEKSDFVIEAEASSNYNFNFNFNQKNQKNQKNDNDYSSWLKSDFKVQKVESDKATIQNGKGTHSIIVKASNGKIKIKRAD